VPLGGEPTLASHLPHLNINIHNTIIIIVTIVINHRR
jgi:hypothetical protein